MANQNPKQISRLEDLAEQVLSAGVASRRRLIGIAGPPGSGKSTLSARLEALLNEANPGACATVPMDGFHYDNQVLSDLGLLPRKGSPETFDIDGLLTLHQRLNANCTSSVAIPVFDRSVELSRAGARLIDQAVPIVLVEGNYLLLQQPGWEELAAFYDLTIRLDVTIGELEDRLTERWLQQGLPTDEAREKVGRNDLPNARLVIEQSALPDIWYNGTEA